MTCLNMLIKSLEHELRIRRQIANLINGDDFQIRDGMLSWGKSRAGKKENQAKSAIFCTKELGIKA